MKAINAILMSVLIIFRAYVTDLVTSLIIDRQPGVTLRGLGNAFFAVLLVEFLFNRNTDLKEYLSEKNLVNGAIVSLGYLLIVLLICFFVF